MTNHSIVVLPGAHASATPLEFAAGASLTQILAGNLNQRACYQQHAAVMRLLD